MGPEDEPGCIRTLGFTITIRLAGHRLKLRNFRHGNFFGRADPCLG